MSDIKWFILPQGSNTNEAIARELAQAGLAVEAETEIMVDGKKLRVWQLPYKFITLLSQSAHQQGFRYTVYVQEGKGKVRKWNLQNQGNVRCTRKYRNAKQEISKNKQ